MTPSEDEDEHEHEGLREVISSSILTLSLATMPTKYLLPCDCGKKLEVESTESGLTKACECGALLVVPKLRELTKLEKVAVADAAYRAWGGRQRGVVLGAVLAVLGFGFGLYASLFIGQNAREYQVAGKMPPAMVIEDDAAPATVLREFQLMQRQGLAAAPVEVVEKYQRQRRVKFWWMLLGFGTGVVGLAVIGLTLAFAGGSPSAKRQPPGKVAATRPVP
jgi:hypothetical protein